MSQQPSEFVTPPPVSNEPLQFYGGPLAVPHKPRVPKIWKVMELIGGTGIVVSICSFVSGLYFLPAADPDERFFFYLAVGGFIGFFASCLIYSIGRGMAWWQQS